MLYRAVIPELRGEILTGEDGGPVQVQGGVEDMTATERARRILFTLEQAARANQA